MKKKKIILGNKILWRRYKWFCPIYALQYLCWSSSSTPLCFSMFPIEFSPCTLLLSPWHSASGFKAAFHKARNFAAHATPQFHSIRPRQRIKSGGARAFRVHTQIHSQTREGVVTYPYPCAETQQTTLHYWIYTHTHAINDCLLLLRCLFFSLFRVRSYNVLFWTQVAVLVPSFSFIEFCAQGCATPPALRSNQCAKICTRLVRKNQTNRNHHRVLSSRRHSLNNTSARNEYTHKQQQRACRKWVGKFNL